MATTTHSHVAQTLVKGVVCSAVCLGRREVSDMHTLTLQAEDLLSCPPKPCKTSAGMSSTSDTALVRRVQARDQTAFRELVEQCQSKVFRVIYGILRNRHDAEDIAQEVFTKVYFSIGAFDGRSSVLTWIYRIAVNECYSWLRKRRTELVCEGGSSGGSLVINLRAADARTASDHALIQRDLVNKALARIPEDDRLLLLWKEVEGFSVKQLTEMTGSNENTVKVKLFRARRRLAKTAARLSTSRHALQFQKPVGGIARSAEVER
jgi:RNA polymerase sigma-70 factor, ECF subfamily